jgi:lipoyl(octanoyl) transferase
LYYVITTPQNIFNNQQKISSSTTILLRNFLSKVPYSTALHWQRQVQNELINNGNTHKNGQIFLLQHEPVITTGVRQVNGLLNGNQIHGIPIIKTERGGLATYHGPGQLTCYFILDLTQSPPFRKDLHWLVTTVEQIVIDTLRIGCGIENAIRIPGRSGVWINHAKVSAVGMGCKKWVTIHGLALNVENQCLDGFRHIVPCGIESQDGSSVVTSVSDVLKLQNKPVGSTTIMNADSLRNILMDQIKYHFGIDLIIQDE